MCLTQRESMGDRRTNDVPPLRVAIVGAGPGGLATAIALSKVPNVDYTIYEKAPVLREYGAGISIGQNTWNVMDLLGAAGSLTSGHPTRTVLNLNGATGEELSRVEKPLSTFLPVRESIRTQRTKLQSALLAHVPQDRLRLGQRATTMEDLGDAGVRLSFADGSTAVADLVVGADGIRSVVRDSAWRGYGLKFTGTTIWRVLLPCEAVKHLDPRFQTTAWWHGPTTHVYLSPVEKGCGRSRRERGRILSYMRMRRLVGNYLPSIREALRRVPKGAWREFAAFAGPELPQLTTWNSKVVLVGDSSHALSGAFGSGAGFAMEDGWILAKALSAHQNDLKTALPLFNKIRLPYYSRMYAHLENEGKQRSVKLTHSLHPGGPTDDERVRSKIIKAGGKDMQWIYENDIGKIWAEYSEVSA